MDTFYFCPLSSSLHGHKAIVYFPPTSHEIVILNSDQLMASILLSPESTSEQELWLAMTKKTPSPSLTAHSHQRRQFISMAPKGEPPISPPPQVAVIILPQSMSQSRLTSFSTDGTRSGSVSVDLTIWKHDLLTPRRTPMGPPGQPLELAEIFMLSLNVLANVCKDIRSESEDC